MTGVDFVPRAIKMARAKAKSSGVSPRFIVGDVTRLGESDVGSNYQLLFDLGCFHSLPDQGRDEYVRGAAAAAAPEATMLLFCFVRGNGPSRIGPRGVAPGEVQRRFADGWKIVGEQAGRPMLNSGTAWYRLSRIE